jgi:hypothetical protein
MYGICTARWDNVLVQVEGPVQDYFDAWRRAGDWAALRPSAVFVVVGYDDAPEDPRSTMPALGLAARDPRG